MEILLNITSGFREVFAKQKFGWSLQGGISKSLLEVPTHTQYGEGSKAQDNFVNEDGSPQRMNDSDIHPTRNDNSKFLKKMQQVR